MSSLHTALSSLSSKVSTTSTLGLSRLFSTASLRRSSCGGALGRCGIPPLAKKESLAKKKKEVEVLPEHLQAPTCIPRGKIGRYPPICAAKSVRICPRDPLRYKYPAYSECNRRPHKIRRLKECCYFPPPSCDVTLVSPTK